MIIYQATKGEFVKSWNLGNTNTLAIEHNSVNEIGCVPLQF